MLGLVFGPDPFLRRLLAARVSSLTPARHQSMLDPQLIEMGRIAALQEGGRALTADRCACPGSMGCARR